VTYDLALAMVASGSSDDVCICQVILVASTPLTKKKKHPFNPPYIALAFLELFFHTSVLSSHIVRRVEPLESHPSL
jgi:hypothetical protein